MTGYKVKIQKQIIFLYTSNESLELEIKKIPFIVAPKNEIKHKSNKTSKGLICGGLLNADERHQCVEMERFFHSWIARSNIVRCQFFPALSIDSVQSLSKSQEAILWTTT